jgi:hypothetical protein
VVAITDNPFPSLDPAKKALAKLDPDYRTATSASIPGKGGCLFCGLPFVLWERSPLTNDLSAGHVAQDTVAYWPQARGKSAYPQGMTFGCRTGAIVLIGSTGKGINNETRSGSI